MRVLIDNTKETMNPYKQGQKVKYLLFKDDVRTIKAILGPSHVKLSRGKNGGTVVANVLNITSA